MGQSRIKPSAPKAHPRDSLWLLLAAVGITALCARCLYLWQIHNAPFFDLRMGDGTAYHRWARSIADGDWLGKGVFYQAPLYPYFLAVVYRLLDDSVTTVRLIQALLGAGSCVLLAKAGISLFGRRGALAGFALAIYPPAIFLDGLIDKTALITFLTTGLLALLAAPAERMTTRRWLAAGLVLGLLALTRENALILLVPLLLWIWFGPFAGPWRVRLRPALVFVSGCLLVLLPVGLRNLALGGEFHLTTAQFGPNFYIGNHAGASGTYEALVLGHGSAVDEQADAIRLAEQALGRKLSSGEVSSYWTRRSLDYIRSQPAAWLALMARKLAFTFNSLELTDTESQDVYADWSWFLRILGPFDFGLLFGLAALGAVLTASSLGRLWFLHALVAAYAASVALFYVFARYRFPMVPMLMLLAAGGLAESFDLVKRRYVRRLAVPALVAVLAFAFAKLPLYDARKLRGPNYLGLAVAFSRQPDQALQALNYYQRLLDIQPGFAPAQLGIGAILERLGRNEEAIPHFRAALVSWPNYAEAHYDLGLALAALGRHQEAAQEYSEASRLDPADADTHIAFGKTLTMLHRPELAAEQFKLGLASRPSDVKALVGLGVAYTQLGRLDEAIRHYRLALEIDPDDAAAHNDLGWTLANQGHIAEALPHFERAVALDPNFANAKENLAEARRALAHSR